MLLLVGAGCIFLTDGDRQAHTDGDGDGASLAIDCDDSSADTYPGAPELCDGHDNDCDGEADEDLGPDADGDGYGAHTEQPCVVGWVEAADCDDSSADTYPGAPELCDRTNNACADSWDDQHELGRVTWWAQDGAAEDWSDAFQSGTPDAPARILLPISGTLAICRSAEPYPVQLLGQAIESLTLVGEPIPLDGEAAEDALPTLAYAASTTGPLLSVSGGGWSLAVERLRLSGAITTSAGAGLRLEGGTSLRLTDVVVEEGLAIISSTEPGAPCGAGALISEVEAVQISGSRFSQNTCTKGSDDAAASSGAGLWLQDVQDAVIEESSFIDNSTDGLGGGIYAGRSLLTLVGGTLSGNSAVDGGGGLLLTESTAALSGAAIFSDNFGDHGGAISIRDATLSCGADAQGDAPLFQANIAHYGGAVFDVRGSDGWLTAAGCRMEENTVLGFDEYYPHAVKHPEIVIKEYFFVGITSPTPTFQCGGEWWEAGCSGDLIHPEYVP